MIQADLTEKTPRRHDSYARQQRAVENFIANAGRKSSHRDERMAAAVEKRLRKNEKRARDAMNGHLGQMRAREALEGSVVTS